jgi:hypothetical protein
MLFRVVTLLGTEFVDGTVVVRLAIEPFNREIKKFGNQEYRISIDRIELFIEEYKEKQDFESLFSFFKFIVIHENTYFKSPVLLEFAKKFVEVATSKGQTPTSELH